MAHHRLFLKYRTKGNRFLQNIFNFNIMHGINDLITTINQFLINFYAESLPESSETGLIYQNKVTLDIPNTNAGKYYVQWTTSWTASTTGKSMSVRIQVIEDPNGTPIPNTLHESSHRPANAYPDYDDSSAFFEYTNPTQQDLRITLDFKANQGGMTAYVKESRLHVFRSVE